MTITWCMVPEIWSVTDIIFCHFTLLPFSFYFNWKIIIDHHRIRHLLLCHLCCCRQLVNNNRLQFASNRCSIVFCLFYIKLNSLFWYKAAFHFKQQNTIKPLFINLFFHFYILVFKKGTIMDNGSLISRLYLCLLRWHTKTYRCKLEVCGSWHQVLLERPLWRNRTNKGLTNDKEQRGSAFKFIQ